MCQKQTFILSASMDPFVQVTNDSCGRAPDVSLAERHGVETDGEPVPVSALALVVLRAHQEGERHFEGVVNLSLVEPKCKARSHTSEHRQDAMTERGHVNVEVADWLHKAARKRNLLLGLAECGGDGALINGIDLAAGKRNLPGVVSKVRRALGEKYARFVAFNDRHQYRGEPDGPHRGNGCNHGGIGVLLIVGRDHIWIGEPRRHIERKPFLRTGKKFRRSETAIVVRGGLLHSGDARRLLCGLGRRVGGDEVAVVGDMVGEKCAKPLNIVAPVAVQFGGNGKLGDELRPSRRHAVPRGVPRDLVECA